MSAIKYLIDLLFLFISLHAAILLRLNLPVGSEVLTAPIISGRIYFFLAIIWGVLFSIDYITSTRFRLGGKTVWIAISALILSFAEYLIISSENSSFSRLFLIFFIVANVIGSFASRRIFLVLQEHAQWLSKRAKQLGAVYSSLDITLYRHYAELITALCAGLIWAEHILKMGLTLTSDSIAYLGFALKTSTSGVLIQNTDWPPFYSIAISATKFLTQFPADGAAIISAASLVIFLLVFALLLRQYSESTVANIILILLFATFHDFINLFRHAWSEQLYTVFVIANFYLLVKHQSRPRWIYFAGAIIFAGMAMITRTIGISVGAMLVLYALVLSEPQTQFIYRLKKYIVPSLLAFIPFIYLIWLDTLPRDAGLASSGVVQVEQGELFAYSFRYSSIVSKTLTTVTDFLKVFWETAGDPYIILSFSLLLFIIIFRMKTLDKNGRELLRIYLIFFLGYVTLSIIAFSVTSHFPRPRYWLPLFFFVFLGIAQTIDLIFKHKNLLYSGFVKRAALLVALVAIPLYSLILQSFGAENTLFDRVRDSRENPVKQIISGFNLSPTAETFRGFFEQISVQYNQNTIVVIEGDYYQPDMIFQSDLETAKPFLLKSSIISSPHLTGFRFFDIRDRQQHLSYYYNEHYKELILILSNDRTITETIHRLDLEAQNNQGSMGVFFVFNEQWFNLFAEEELGNELAKLQLIAHNEPYLIFEFHSDSSLTE
ncbi:MAG: glycosyltransferase family 39 protein [Anaerolineales bacterium]